MGEAVGQEKPMLDQWNTRGQRLDQPYQTSIRQQIADDACDQSRECHHSQQDADRSPQFARREPRIRAHSGYENEGPSEQQAHPPSCNCAPTKSKQRWIFGGKNWWVADRKILETNTKCYLGLENSISND